MSAQGGIGTAPAPAGALRMRSAQIEEQAAKAVRTLRRLQSMSEAGGWLILAMASQESILLLADAQHEEITFRTGRPPHAPTE